MSRGMISSQELIADMEKWASLDIYYSGYTFQLKLSSQYQSYGMVGLSLASSGLWLATVATVGQLCRGQVGKCFTFPSSPEETISAGLKFTKVIAALFRCSGGILCRHNSN